MTEHKAYVRSAWDGGAKCWLDFSIAPDCWKVQVGDEEHAVVIVCLRGSSDAAWAASSSFTVERAESIRLKAREIDECLPQTYEGDEDYAQWLRDGSDGVDEDFVREYVRTMSTMFRTLSTLEQQLGDLCRGLKPEFVERAKRG